MAGTAEIATALAFLDAVGDEMGAGKLSQVVEGEALAKVSMIGQMITPVVQGVLAQYLMRCELQDVSLNPDRPFSDESLSGALSQVLGVPVASIKDGVALRQAFKGAVALRLGDAAGVRFEDIGNKSLVRRDVLRAIGQHSSKLVPGLELRDLSSREQTVSDVEEYARHMVSSATGINFTNLRSIQDIKEDIYAWAMPIIREILLDEEQESNSAKPLKMDRKSIRNREAQRRFRATHGRREVYVGIRERGENQDGPAGSPGMGTN